jgi:hypothetical protein
MCHEPEARGTERRRRPTPVLETSVAERRRLPSPKFGVRTQRAQGVEQAPRNLLFLDASDRWPEAVRRKRAPHAVTAKRRECSESTGEIRQYNAESENRQTGGCQRGDFELDGACRGRLQSVRLAASIARQRLRLISVRSATGGWSAQAVLDVV